MGTCGSASANRREGQYCAGNDDADGGVLIASGSNGTMRELQVPHGGSSVTALAGMDAACFLSGGRDGTLALCDWALGEVSARCVGHAGAVTDITVGTTTVWSASRDRTLRQWRRGELQLAGDAASVSASASASALASAVASARGPAPVPTPVVAHSACAELTGHELTVSACALLGGGQDALCSGSRDCTVRLWDTATSSEVARAHRPRNLVTCLRALGAPPAAEGAGPGGGAPLLAVQGGEDLSLRVWDWRAAGAGAAGALEAQRFSGYVYFPLCVDTAQAAGGGGGTLLLTGSKGFNGAGCEVRLWDTRRTAAPVVVLSGHAQDVTACCFLGAEGRTAATASKDGTVRLWALGGGGGGGGECTAVLPLPGGAMLTALAATQLSARGGGAEAPMRGDMCAGSFDGGLYVLACGSGSGAAGGVTGAPGAGPHEGHGAHGRLACVARSTAAPETNGEEG
eukprot:g2491.t1